MISLTRSALASFTLSAFLAGTASAAVVYTEDFEGYVVPPAVDADDTDVPTVDKLRGFGDTLVDGVAQTAGTSDAALLDAFFTPPDGFSRGTVLLVDTGAAVTEDTTYTFTFDLFKAGTAGGTSTDNDYTGEVIVSLYAADSLTAGDFDLSGTGAVLVSTSPTLLASTTYGGTTEGLALEVAGTSDTTGGSLFVTIDAQVPTATGTGDGYAQVEVDRFSLDATVVPEPGSLALLGLGGGLMALRRR